MSNYIVTIRGTRPLIMHNGQLKDPTNPWAKKIKVVSKKRDKSDDDYLELSRLEWEGGLYFHPDVGPYLPADNLQAAMLRGAAKRKLKKLFAAVVEVSPPDHEPEGYALEYKGPRDIEGMWRDRAFWIRKDVTVNQKAVVRTRPRFPAGWKCTFAVEILDEGVSKTQVEQAFNDAGMYEALGDWKPRYGRFVVESMKSN